MTTINIDGPITSIITMPETVVTALTVGQNGSDPTPITRLANRTVVIGSYVGPGNEAPGRFQIDGTFNIGDIIEYYGDQPVSFPQPVAPGIILDENGTEMLITTGIGRAIGSIFRKISNNPTGCNWAQAK